MIPKILHFVWFGVNPLPIDIVNSWKAHHGDYEIKIWTEKEVDAFKLQNKNHWVAAKNRFNQKSDIARYEILLRYGGVYVDTDIYCMARIPDDWLSLDSFCCFEKKYLVSNSFIACKPGHSIMKDIVNVIGLNYNYEETIWKCTGPLLFTNYIKTIVDEKNKIFKPTPVNLCIKWSKQLMDKPDDFNLFLQSESQITNPHHNKDLVYKWDKDEIVGVQIWMGGNNKNYNKLRKFTSNIETNFMKYVDFLQETQNMKLNNFDTTQFRLK